MALIPDATKALEAERAIIVRARDEANDRMKSIIIKGQAERAGAQKFRGNLKRDDGWKQLLSSSRKALYENALHGLSELGERRASSRIVWLIDLVEFACRLCSLCSLPYLYAGRLRRIDLYGWYPGS